jgi:hypothetical protein
MPRIPALAASLCLLLGASACGGDNKASEEDIVKELSATLQAGGEGFDEETADCFAKIVVDEVGLEELQDIDISEDPPPELQDEIAAATIPSEPPRSASSHRPADASTPRSQR